MTAIVELKNATKIVNTGIEEEKVILNDVSLDIFEHDFITILGGNGAGKSTLFNVIAGTLPLTSGSIYILGENVTSYSPEKRAKYLSRVFQDPKMGTAPRMTVAENLLIAKFRGEKRRLVPRRLSHYRKEFQETIDKIGNGLEKHLDTPIEFLSGGQRQALSLLMATLKRALPTSPGISAMWGNHTGRSWRPNTWLWRNTTRFCGNFPQGSGITFIRARG